MTRLDTFSVFIGFSIGFSIKVVLSNLVFIGFSIGFPISVEIGLPCDTSTVVGFSMGFSIKAIISNEY